MYYNSKLLNKRHFLEKQIAKMWNTWLFHYKKSFDIKQTK